MFTFDFSNLFCFYPKYHDGYFYGYFAWMRGFEYDPGWSSSGSDTLDREEKTV